MKSYNINSKNLLIIPDLHQDINWVKTIFDKEKGNFDTILSLGDEFDSFKSYPEVATVKETAEFVLELQSGKYGSYFGLMGNHSVAYYESFKYHSQHRNPKQLFNMCSGYTNNKGKEISKIMSLESWQKFHLFYIVNGYFISHAGLAPNFWNFYLDQEQNHDILWEKSKNALKLINVQPDPLLSAGLSRGGHETVGGLTWNDESDFVDFNESLPQIAGHSESYNHIRKHGRSYFLDGSQTTYAILHDDGNLELKSIKNWFHFSKDGMTTEMISN